MEKYVELLRERNLKITPQRLEIIKYLDKNRVHPDAEGIYCSLKSDNPSLSRTTVYNTLELLRVNNIITGLCISGREMRYCYDEAVHHHFLCKGCGEITGFDFDLPDLTDLKNRGFAIEEVHLYSKGYCSNCRNDRRKIA